MKKITPLLALLVLLVAACSNRDEKVLLPSNTGTLTVNGIAKSVSNGYIIMPYTGTNPDYDARRFYIVLTNGTVAFEGNDLVYSDDIEQLIDFNLYTDRDSSGAVQSTTYNLYIPDSGFDFSNALIDHTGINTNIVVNNGEWTSGVSLDSDDMDAGQLILNQDNGLYTLQFSFSNDGNTISGSYTGNLRELNPQF